MSLPWLQILRDLHNSKLNCLESICHEAMTDSLFPGDSRLAVLARILLWFSVNDLDLFLAG